MQKLWRAVAAGAALSLVVSVAPAGAGSCGDRGCAPSAASPAAGSATADAGSPATAVHHFGAWGFDLSGRDLSVKPGTDFYLYANGDWLKRTTIPPDKSRFGNFSELGDVALAATHQLIEAAAAGHSDDRDAAKVGTAYRSYMDEARVEQLDAKPLAPDLAAIRAEKTKEDVAALMGTAMKGHQSTIFGLRIAPDDKAPDHYAVHIGNGGMGLPDRDYYLQPQLAEKKAKYQDYVALMLGMIGWADPAINAKAIVDLETKLAEASWTRVEKRDPIKTYNPMSPAELTRYAPGFDFQALLRSADLGSVDRLIVGTNTAFPKVAKIFDTTPLDTLKAWQAFHLASSAAALLSKRFVDAWFNFYGTTLSGQPENIARWKRAVYFTDGVLDDSVGRMYVAKYFPPEAKAKADALVKELLAAMQKRLEAVDWMSPATKAKALEKLSKFTLKIGYPAKWRDYTPLTMAADDLYGNSGRSHAYEWDYQVQRLNKPVDKQEWDLSAYEVNAEYVPTKNDITFPAAILQPPFFDPKADMAVNYGAIGAVIGHEITHGFDDQGRHYDGSGTLKEWWTAEDAAKFKSQADRLAAQFDKFEPVKGYFVNGQLTMGENIADLGGLLLALDAYHASLHGKEAPMIDGLTGDQRLFFGFAQVWREKVRPDRAIQLTKVDVHSPTHFRIDGPVRNVQEWYDAFKITPADPMYIAPDKRVHIW